MKGNAGQRPSHSHCCQVTDDLVDMPKSAVWQYIKRYANLSHRSSNLNLDIE
jgi:hypothetical protein